MTILMPIGSFLASLLVLFPLPGHWRARNVPTISIIIWSFVVNFINGVNTVIWANSTDIKFVVWCDIVTRVGVAANIALPAACFCLCVHLERVASVRSVTTSHSDKRKRMVIDLGICWLVPMIYVALYYIVQGHRFDIVESFGCRAEDYVSIPQFCLVWLPPILFALATFVFAGLAFVHFLRRRATFAKHLAHSNGGLNTRRYFRLMSMSIVEMLWTLLVVGLNCWFNYRTGIRPWTNWEDVHFNFSRIDRYPLALIPRWSLRWTYFLWWTVPISAYIFFFFFAFGQDAMKDYRACISWVRGLFPLKKHQNDANTQFVTVESKSIGSILPLHSSSLSEPMSSLPANDMKHPAFKSNGSFPSTMSTSSFDRSSPPSPSLTSVPHISFPPQTFVNVALRSESRLSLS